ncbi:hypothetical protein ACHHYP_01842 [Achlya hypogyna]|uniref:ubiquitinyl hydrolase 1 n=1 Tax=Achlya hypogyna TaxID=1202772 RepID=A0A1V9ZSR8_ACHHY|nr:hypothetical protein ACHHYP_01842 [Achlya hypogyna]
MWSVRLRAPTKSAVLRIADSSTFAAFRDQALETLGLKNAEAFTCMSNDASLGTHRFVVKGGFPPKELHADANDPISGFLQNNDTVVVEAAMIEPATARISRSTATKLATSSKTNRRTTPAPKSAGKKKRAVAPKFTGQGRVLGATADSDDEPVAISPSPPKRRKKLHLGSTEDVATKLVTAVSGGGTTTADKFFRRATKTAVTLQYEATLANARLHAALGGAFTITAMPLGESGIAQMQIRFKERERTWREETLDLLQPVELTSIVKYVLLSGGETGREMLKPFNMAQCSPRVFWSLARLAGGDVAKALESLLPDEDWSYLDTRTRTLSAKALAAQVVTQSFGANTNSQYYRNEPQTPAAATREATAADEDLKPELANRNPAIEPSHVDRAAMRSVVAKAALARLRTTTLAPPTASSEAVEGAAADASAMTTVVCDRCSKARMFPSAHNDLLGIDGAGDWTCENLVRLGRTDGCVMPDDEVLALAADTSVAACLQQLGITSRAQLADADAEAIFSTWRVTCRGYRMDLDRLGSLIELAREQELDTIVQEIVGDDRVFSALEARKLATPHDLKLTPTDLIQRDLRLVLGDEIPMAAIEGWKAASCAAVKRHPWLQDWRSV